MKWRLLIAVIILLLVGTAGIFFLKPLLQNSKKTPNLQELLSSNQAYIDAEIQLKNKNPQAAYTLYEQALAQAKTPIDRGFIEDRSARALAAAGNYVAAVPVFISIAANNSYYELLRAYALTEIISLYEIYQDQKITSTVFSTDPYKVLTQNVPNWAPITGSYKNLALYSEHFYPTAQAGLDTALWDAENIENLKSAGPLSATSSVFVANGMTEITSQIALAQADLPRIIGNSLYITDLPEVYSHEAELSVLLQNIGATSTALADPETLYKKALSAIAVTTSSAGYANYASIFEMFTSYSYAFYLAHTYGSLRKTDIQSLLANIYNASSTPSIVTSFFTSPGALKGSVHEQITTLTLYDPEFKDYVISLGWH